MVMKGEVAGGPLRPAPPTLHVRHVAFPRPCFVLVPHPATTPGLKELEEPLLSTGLLQEVKARCGGKVAVVTGRPRRDAEEAIHRFGCVLPPHTGWALVTVVLDVQPTGCLSVSLGMSTLRTLRDGMGW
jgi:hypothetical protein